MAKKRKAGKGDQSDRETLNRYGFLRKHELYTGVRWRDVLPEALVRFVDMVTVGGDAVVISRSRDGKQLTVTILNDGEPVRDREDDADEMSEYMSMVANTLQADAERRREEEKAALTMAVEEQGGPLPALRPEATTAALERVSEARRKATEGRGD